MHNDPFEILREAKTIAVVGASPHHWRPSFDISRYLQQVGYRMIPVNPHHDTILGETCYPSLMDVPLALKIDVVNIFRRSIFTAEVVMDVLERIEKTNEKPVIWTQIGVSSRESKQLAESHGLVYIEEACIKVVHTIGANQPSRL